MNNKTIMVIALIGFLLGALSFSLIQSLDDVYLKLSGGTMNGSIDINNKTIYNLKNVNQSSTIKVYANTNLPLDFIAINNPAIPRYYSYGSSSFDIGNYFVGIRFDGNYSNPQPLKEKDSIFRIAGAGGYDNSGTPSSSAIWIDFRADGDWNATSIPARMEIQIAPNGSVGKITRFVIWSNGTLQVNSLSGTGSGYACTDPDGKLYRGTTCS